MRKGFVLLPRRLQVCSCENYLSGDLGEIYYFLVTLTYENLAFENEECEESIQRKISVQF